MTAPVLSFEALTGGYDDTVVIRGISGRVEAGQVLGVVGRNGVGKTTLVRLLMGLAQRQSGEIRLGSTDLVELPAHRRQRLGLGCMPQEQVVFDDLTVAENLRLGSHVSASRLPLLLDRFPRVRERLAQRAGTLSGGEKKLVSFVRAVAEEAAVTLLDEPSEGLQQENIDRMGEVIRERGAEGAAFVLIEQNLTLLLGTMHSTLLLDHGEVVRSGSAAAFDRDALERHLRV